jgi:hypothetical protein
MSQHMSHLTELYLEDCRRTINMSLLTERREYVSYVYVTHVTMIGLRRP